MCIVNIIHCSWSEIVCIDGQCFVLLVNAVDEEICAGWSTYKDIWAKMHWTDWELDEKAGFDFFVTASRFEQCHSAIPTIGIFWSWKEVRLTLQIDDCQSFARFWEVEIQQRALLKTWKDPFSSLFVANNKKWLEETSLIVEVEEETTSELGRLGPGAKRKKRSNADLKGALVGS